MAISISNTLKVFKGSSKFFLASLKKHTGLAFSIKPSMVPPDERWKNPLRVQEFTVFLRVCTIPLVKRVLLDNNGSLLPKNTL